MAARTARLYDAVHDQLFERADAGHRAAEEGQRGPQVTGDDAEDGGGQHADSGWIAVDVDAGASGTCEWTDTADDWIPSVLVGKRFRKWRGDFLDHVITIIFYFVYFIKLLSAIASLYVYAISKPTPGSSLSVYSFCTLSYRVNNSSGNTHSFPSASLLRDTP